MNECFSNHLSGRDTTLMAFATHQILPMRGAAVDIADRPSVDSAALKEIISPSK